MKLLNKKKILMIVPTLFVAIAVISLSDHKERRSPSSQDNYISSEQLEELGPIGLLELLKEECCRPFVVEPIDNIDWIKEEDIKEIERYVSSTEKVSAVVSIHSSLPCIGDKYISTLSNEAQHLLYAYQEGRYPLAMCSTYDLELNQKNTPKK